MWALDNPGKAALGITAAFTAAIAATRMIPQLVIMGGGKIFSKLTKSIRKLVGKTAPKTVTKAVMKNTGKTVTGAAAQNAVKAGTATASKTVGKNVAKNVGKTTTKTVGKSVAKTAGKSLLKKIPGVGLLAGLYFAGEKLLEGDFAGAGLEVLSGAASTIPVVGTAASLAIDGGIAYRDMNKASSGETAADFISRPGQPIQKFRADDVIVGGTNLGGDNGEVATLLKELISAVKEGGDVFIDGAKAGRSLALATSRIG